MKKTAYVFVFSALFSGCQNGHVYQPCGFPLFSSHIYWITGAAVLFLGLIIFLVILNTKIARKNKTILEKSAALNDILQKSIIAKKEIELRERMLFAVNNAAHLLLTAENESFSNSLLSSMEIIGNCVDTDCIELWQNEMKNGELHAVLKHYWHSEKGSEAKSITAIFDFPYSKSPGWEIRLSRGEIINGPVSGISKADRLFLLPYSVASILVIPVFLQNQFWGFFCIDDCRKSRTFTKDEVAILKSICLIIASIINRLNLTSEIKKSQERAQLMLESIPISCVLITKNYKLIDCNSEAVKIFKLRDKQEFLERAYDLMPEYQPDGSNSILTMQDKINETFEKGKCSFEWVLSLLDGTQIPVLFTYERVFLNKGYLVLGSIQDLRKQKLAEKALQNAYKHSKIMLDSIPICCCLITKELRIIDCNNEALVLTGANSVEEFLDNYNQNRFFPDYQPNGRESVEMGLYYAKKASEEGKCTFEVTFQTLNGTLIPALATYVRIEYNNDDGYIILSCIQDLREIKRMTARIEAIINNLPGMVFQQLYDPPNYTYTFVSNGCKELTGYSPEELIGKSTTQILNVSHPDYNLNFVDELSKRTLLNDLPFEATFKITTRDGTEKWVWELSRVLEKKSDGTPYMIEGYTTDISERWQLEAEKREKEKIVSSYEYAEKLSDTLAKITMSSVISKGALKDAADLIAQEGCRVLNTTRIEVWGVTEDKTALKYLSCFDAFAGGFVERPNFNLKEYGEYENLIKSRRLISTNDSSVSSVYFNSRDSFSSKTIAGLDAPVWIDDELAGMVIIEQESCEKFPQKREWLIEEQSFSSSLADLMALAISSAERRTASQVAEAASRAKSEFLAVMSHEIRTPMNSIMGFAELALEGNDIFQVYGYLEKIKDSTKWLLNIINDILDISKIESGKMEIEKIPFDLRGVISRCQSAVFPDAKEKGLDLKIYAELPANRMLLGDQVRLYQALLNLLSNAVKFTNTGTIKLSAFPKKMSGGRTTVYFEVKDTGIGMNSEQAVRIFDSFVQADSSTTRNFGGTGLGLAITKNLIMLMGGKLELESSPGAGSKFSFEIEFETIEAPDGISKAAKDENIEKPYFNGLILSIDDNYMNQEVMCEHLTNVGIRTVTADNGKDGVLKVEERIQKGEPPFDLIFMDMYMPVMDGIEAASKIAALKTGTPVVAVTANVMASELERYKECGMPDCLGKPFTSQELWRILLKYLKPVNNRTENENEQIQAENYLQKKLKLNFLKTGQAIFTEITGAIDAGDIKLAHRLAHTLKGNAGMIGKEGLRNIAWEIESLLNEKKLPLPEHCLNRLKTEILSVLEELSPLLQEQKEETELLDAGKILALFEKIEPMLKNSNPEAADLLDDIRAIPGTGKLAGFIENYDFDAALKVLGELMKKRGKEL